jgi:hypothetical protein
VSRSVALALLAEGPADAKVSPGLAGFLVTFGLAVATLFLVRSMVRHLRKVRYGPEPEDLQSTAHPSAPAAGTPAARPPTAGTSTAGGRPVTPRSPGDDQPPR